MIHQQPILLSVNGVYGSGELASVVRHAMDRGFNGIEFEPDQNEAPALGENVGSFACVATVNCTSIDLESAVRLVSASLRCAGRYRASCLTLLLPPLRGFRKSLNTSVVEQEATSGIEKELSGEFEHYEDALNFADALLWSVRFHAEQTGVPLALVVGEGGCFLSPVEARELLNRAQTWAVGACLDQTIVDRVDRLHDWVETLGHRVLCVRLSNITPLDHATSLSGKDYPGPIVVPEDIDPAQLRSALSMTSTRTG